MARRHRERRWELESEPWPWEADLVECGGEMYVAAGFTPAGFPYGCTIGEFRESMREAGKSRGWARAARALRLAVGELGLPEPEIGRIRKVGQGLARGVFAAEVDPGAEGWPRVLVALVPHGSAALRGTREVEREARLLQFLARQELSFRVPSLALAVRDGEDAILVCECLGGIEVDLRAGRMNSVRPWKLVGEIAADIHRIPVDELAWLGGHATRREHGERLVEHHAPLRNAPEAVVRDAHRWLGENLPPDEPARLLHGDLLGQNLLMHPDRPTAVVDWEHALLGDPAYDLAIVTRGVRQPFQIAGGLAKLLAAYAERSGVELREREVRFHEIGLHLEWLLRALSGEAEVEPAPAVLARLRNLMRAVEARS